MADVDFCVGDTGEDLPEPPRRPTRRLSIALVAALTALTLGVVLARGHHAARHAAAASALPTPTATRQSPHPPGRPDASPLRADGSDVLDYTGVFAESGSLGSGEITYVFDLVNESTTDVSITYPILLVGPGGVVIPSVFAGVYDSATAASHINDSAQPPNRLKRIRAGLPESLVIRIQINCSNAARTWRSPGAQPAIHIHLAGFSTPAVFTFSNLASGFDDAIRQVCGA